MSELKEDSKENEKTHWRSSEMVGRTGRVLGWHIFGRRGGRIDRGIIDLDLRRSNASDGCCCNCRRHRSILSHTFHPAGHNTREDDDEEKFGGRHRDERSCLEIFSGLL